MIKTYTKQELEDACKHSKSLRDVLRYLGEKIGGHHERQIKEQLVKNCVDTSHFITLNVEPKTNDELFVKNSNSGRSSIRRRILADNLIEYKCAICGCTENWHGMIIALHLDHIDGDGSNNELSNLRFLCPNCHAGTDTYAGHNITLKRQAAGLPVGKDAKKARERDLCPVCGVYKKSVHSSMCVECNRKRQRENQCTAEQFEEYFANGLSVIDIARMKNVTEGSVRHWMKRLGVTPPTKRQK